jgi:hypothetical protein
MLFEELKLYNISQYLTTYFQQDGRSMESHHHLGTFSSLLSYLTSDLPADNNVHVNTIDFNFTFHVINSSELYNFKGLIKRFSMLAI